MSSSFASFCLTLLLSPNKLFTMTKEIPVKFNVIYCKVSEQYAHNYGEKVGLLCHIFPIISLLFPALLFLFSLSLCLFPSPFLPSFLPVYPPIPLAFFSRSLSSSFLSLPLYALLLHITHLTDTTAACCSCNAHTEGRRSGPDVRKFLFDLVL